MAAFAPRPNGTWLARCAGMHPIIRFASFAFALSVVALPLRASAEPPGQKVFLDYKCNKCHTVASAKIEATKKPKDGEKAAPDLSDVGTKQKREWIDAYIHKKETLDGKKHKVLFRGDDAELKSLLDWLTSLKSPAKK